MDKRLKWLAAGGSAIGIMAAEAAAHSGHAGGHGLAAGFLHPITGADHLLAALAVGAFAARKAGAPGAAASGAFLVAIIFGFALARLSIVLPVVETTILASIVIFGVLAAMARRIDLTPALGAIALFGVFHGYGHGLGAMAPGAPGFLAGVVASTALLVAGAAAATRLAGGGAGMLQRDIN